MEAVQLSWCKAAGTNLKVGGSNPPTATTAGAAVAIPARTRLAFRISSHLINIYIAARHRPPLFSYKLKNKDYETEIFELVAE